MNDVYPLAAIVYPPGQRTDHLMRDVVAHLRTAGVQVGGIVQHDVAGDPADPCAMALEDLGTGERIALSQSLGSGSAACRLDPAALAHAAVIVLEARTAGAELVIVNKFGAQEAGGGGLRAEIADLVASGTPLLTTVGERFVADWQQFTGGGGVLLPPVLSEVLAWYWQLRSQQTARPK